MDTPAPSYRCSGADCADKAAQPKNRFLWIHRTTFRSRGVPLLCKKCLSAREIRNLATEFDVERLRLGLNGDQQALVESKVLRAWAVKHANERFVPETLLGVWGITVQLGCWDA